MLTQVKEKEVSKELLMKLDLDYNVQTAKDCGRIIQGQRTLLRQQHQHNRALRSELDSLF